MTEERKLAKPAQIGGTIFDAGVSERLVIERAQREHEYQQRPEAKAERRQRLDAFLAAVAGEAHELLQARERELGGKLSDAARRRYRVASTLCACHMTDGFCSPLNEPQCHCWKLADTVIRAFDDWPAPPHMESARRG